MTPVIVCGLGTLGQDCARKLKEFGASVTGIELAGGREREAGAASHGLDRLVAGDCRDAATLEEAGIASARAIVIVTQEDRVNIASAFAARALNARIRIVVRSAEQNLNDLLQVHLGDFAAFEPTRLSADAFALAALGDDTLGVFDLEGRSVRITQKTIGPEHPWAGRRALFELDSHSARILTTGQSLAAEGFCAFDSDAIVRAGDRVTYLELDAGFEGATSASAAQPTQQESSRGLLRGLLDAARARWLRATRTQQVAAISALVLFTLYSSGVVLYKTHYPDLSLQDALNLSYVLVIGGYDNIFGSLKLPFPIPAWLHVFSISESIAGTVFIGIVYAFLTERVLSARFQFRSRRPPVPSGNHVAIVGLGRVGLRVASILQGLKTPLAGSDQREIEAAALPQMPFVAGRGAEVLEKLNFATAAGVMALTGDEVANLEIALLVRARNASCRLVIRTEDPHFSQNVSRLVPHACALGVHDLAAEAFAAAAFGERIVALMRIDGQTTLATDYRVEAGDALEGRTLGDVTYGYGIVPVLHESGGQHVFLPTDGARLKAGDRLVVLATVDGLQRAERGTPRERAWTVHIVRASTKDGAFEGAMTIARVTGCEIETARQAMERLPASISVPLYERQARRLVRELSRLQVEARLEELEPSLSHVE
ncbi:MAG: NAD-binding protein [Candidatus Baltobacteraceae bacterium]